MAPHALSAALLSLLALSVQANHIAPRSASHTITTAPAATVVSKAIKAIVTPTNSPLPLTDYSYAYSAVPYQVNPYAVGRGPQSGYNQCNTTTEGADSQCQTAIINSAADFCLWGSPGLYPNGTIGDVEAAVVAYCTRSGHGARIMPAGTITAVQFMKTAGYIQVVGLLNQVGINLNESDSGGELDPHGADLLGNPLGGLVYSTGLPSGNNETYLQANSWNNFIGGGKFCFKLCDPSYSTTLNYCQNIYDLIGCDYNMPAAYTPDVFESCEGDLQDEVATYTSAGATYTWSQPSVLPATSTLPWTPRVPSSSNCVTYQSSDLFPVSLLGYQSTSAIAASGSTVALSSSGAVATGKSGSSSSSHSGSGSGSGSSTATKTASTTGASSTASSSGAAFFGAPLVALFGAVAVVVAAI